MTSEPPEPARRPRPAVALVLAGLVAALVTAGVVGRHGTTAAPLPVPTPSASPAPRTPDPTPAPEPPCAVTVAGTTTQLSGRRAKAYTAAAALAYRQGTAVPALARALGRIRTGDRAEAEVAAAFVRPTATPAAGADLALARALRGQAGPALTCTWPRAEVAAAEPLGPTGLTASAARLRGAIQAAFGRQIMGGFAPGGVSTGHADGSAHYEGRAMDVFRRPVSAANEVRGWTMAQWIVAHGDAYRVLSVIWRERIWTVWASGAGWRPYVPSQGPTSNPILRHLDHIHTAVVGVRRSPSPTP